MNKRFIATAVFGLALVAPLPYMCSKLPSKPVCQEQKSVFQNQGVVYRQEEMLKMYDELFLREPPPGIVEFGSDSLLVKYSTSAVRVTYKDWKIIEVRIGSADFIADLSGADLRSHFRFNQLGRGQLEWILEGDSIFSPVKLKSAKAAITAQLSCFCRYYDTNKVSLRSTERRIEDIGKTLRFSYELEKYYEKKIDIQGSVSLVDGDWWQVDIEGIEFKKYNLERGFYAGKGIFFYPDLNKEKAIELWHDLLLENK